MNNIIEQDHRFFKRKTKLMLGFKSFDAARKTLAGVDLVRMLKKGQLRKTRGDDFCVLGRWLRQNRNIPWEF